MSRSTIMVILLFLSPASTLAADQPAADACARKLGSGAKQVYDLVAPEVNSTTIIKDLVVQRVKPLVMAGKMSRDVARAAAESAGECLTILK